MPKISRLFSAIVLLVSFALPARAASEAGRLFAQAEELMAKEDAAGAEKIYRDIRERFPSSKAAAYSGYRLGSIHLGAGDLDAAEAELSSVKMEAVKPDVFVDTLLALTTTQARAQKYSEAKETLARLLELVTVAPFRAREILAFGFRLDAMVGEPAAAIQLYDRWMTLSASETPSANEQLGPEELTVVAGRVPTEERASLRAKIVHEEVKARLAGRQTASVETESGTTTTAKSGGISLGAALSLSNASFTALDLKTNGSAAFSGFPAFGVGLSGEYALNERLRLVARAGIAAYKLEGPKSYVLSSTSASVYNLNGEVKFYLDSDKLWEAAVGAGLVQSLFFVSPSAGRISVGKQSLPFGSVSITRALGKVVGIPADVRGEAGLGSPGKFYGLGLGVKTRVTTRIDGRLELGYRASSFTNDLVSIHANEIGLRFAAAWRD